MYILSDTEEILVLIVGLSLVIGLLIKSYRDYKSMTNEYNIKMRKKEKDEKYVKNLIKEINAKNELLKKTAELIKKNESNK
tara:strand:+ start:3613 stop:3855 length:243 start_codon:yes stop_codon:yes gene_type:complete